MTELVTTIVSAQEERQVCAVTWKMLVPAVLVMPVLSVQLPQLMAIQFVHVLKGGEDKTAQKILMNVKKAMFLPVNILVPVLMCLDISDVIVCLDSLEIDVSKTSMNVNLIRAKMMERVLMNVEISDVFVCLVSLV